MEIVLGVLYFTAILLVVLYGFGAAVPKRCAAVLALGQVGVAGYLWSIEWHLAADIVLVALPPLVAAVLLSPPLGPRRAPWRTRSALLAASLHGYAILNPPAPPYLYDSLVMLAVLTAGAGLAWLWQRSISDRLPRVLRVAVVITIAGGLVVSGLITASELSRLPAAANMAEHGAVDHGGGRQEHAHHGTDISTLTGPRDRAPDVRHTLTARTARVRLASGESIDAWTFDGTLPGPELRARQGDLVEVTLVNADIPAGVTIHWHGLDVPNAEDGVAGLTQDAVRPGGRHVYRFVADQVGTFWYHSHQRSDEQVRRGLFGAIVIEPRRPTRDVDLAVMAHAWPDQMTALSITGNAPSTRVTRRAVPSGSRVRLRLINADNQPRVFAITGTPFRVVAIDGTNLSEPPEITQHQLLVAGGGRYDVVFTMPAGPVRLAITRDDNSDGDATLLFGNGQPEPVTERPVLDPSSYGAATGTPFSTFERRFTVLLGETFAFYNGRFGQRPTINGSVFPDTPAFAVEKGDVVKVTFVSRAFENHPMHLHGHHMLVLSRNGKPVTGSPWWADTLNVAPGERYEVAFRADNPGLWMDHCHNLEHAAGGMTMHLMYLGYHTPFRVGPATGNQPE